MDQVKIGQYISRKRKDLGLTQKDLAEKIDVTDKSISKWERGNGLPDVTRLAPLCEALKISMNELVAGEDIAEAVLSEKTEENIMTLMKENEKQKNNNMVAYVLGGALSLMVLVLLGISMAGSTVQAVGYFVNPVDLIFIILILGISLLFTRDRSKEGICNRIQKMAIPTGAFLALFHGVFAMAELVSVDGMGTALAGALLPALYGIMIYMIITVVKSN